MSMLRLALALALACFVAGPLAAQQVRLEGRQADERAVRELRALLDRDSYLLLERDTVLGADFSTDGDVLVVNADVRLSGRVAGAIAVVRGSVFLRPGAIVGGPVVEIGGEALRSALAAPVEIIESSPGLAVVVAPDAQGYTIRTAYSAPAERVVLPGFFGLAVPTHDRVSGTTVRWATGLRLAPGRSASPELRASAALRVARRTADGGVGLHLPLGDDAELVLAAERTTLTNEAWYRGDLSNSLSSIAFGSDLRDYYESDRVTLGVGPARLRGLAVGEHHLAPSLRFLYSRDRSLGVADAWSLFKPEGGWRPNPPIDDGEIASGYLGAQHRWRGITARSALVLGVERTIPGAGDHQFTQAMGSVGWEMITFGAQTLQVRAYGRATLDDDPAPRQRWTIFGGGATLPTLPVAARRGDNFAFVHSLYAVPLAFVPLGPLGPPSLQLAHGAGNAWVTGAVRVPWAQNLGVGLGTRFVYARVYFDPEAPRRSATLVTGIGF